MKQILMSALSIVLITSCKDKTPEDIVNTIPKDGAIETNVKVEHLNDSTDVLITEHKIWQTANNSKAAVHYDTILSLGKTMEKDEKGDSKTVNKDYNIYITVK